MKRLSKVVVVLVIMFSFTFSAVAKEESTNFSVSGTAYSQEEVNALKEKQEKEALSYKRGLSSCYDFNYVTNVEESDDTFDTITVETNDEKDSVVEEKEDEGYTVTAEEKMHEKETEEYEFNTLNGRVKNAKVDGSTTNDYNGVNSEELLNDEFSDFEDGDSKIVNTITIDSENINGSEVRPSFFGANLYATTLRRDGYTTSIRQNNTERTSFEITSKRRLLTLEARLQATNKALNDNPDKDILDLRLNATINPRVVKKEEYSTSDERDARARELEATGLYERVELVTDIDQSDTHLVSTNQEVEWTSTNEDPYYEDVYTDNDVTGYRYYYLAEKEIAPEEVKTNTYLTMAACQVGKAFYRDYDSVTCERTAPFVYTLTAIKNRVTTMQGYYDEYKYAIKYLVNYSYYSYKGSYIATDYTVSYTGNKSNIKVVKDTYDKYYDINGTRKLYNVVTTGEKEDNNSCKTITTTTATTDEGKTVNTGVRENTYYKVVLLSSLLVLIATVALRKRLCK